MGSSGPTSVLLTILNVVQVILGFGITCVALWFFVEVYNITSLRNSNHYLLDYKLYWPQAIPWVFILAGLLVICVSGCGFVGAKKKSSGFVTLFIAFEVTAILALIAAAIVALTLADTNSTAAFMKDAIWDVYTHMRSDRSVETAFGNFEKRFQCCGAEGPRDYKNWRDEFPISCCDTYYHGFIGSYAIDCDFSNKLANERYGCAKVVINYTSIIIKVLAGAAIFTAFIGIMNLVVGVTLSRSLKRKPRQVVQMESESKKVLL
ncbi:unnamed protein product [Arctia plantaginis]|uniref:Tetraspanin n=1 Tax=Arctia plantaginis TaxID=874455 RepID=A0A8S1A642_ARCPL|nr:unnamed protein product [Arctia plantaginis]CAB3241622.1 unnamed protein product [Arctia plantaginis]